jgi:hemin uptake protein HemP
MNNQSGNTNTEKTSVAPQLKRERPPPRVSSSRLLGERGELVIEHEGREYRLRLTQNRKLILTA